MENRDKKTLDINKLVIAGAILVSAGMVSWAVVYSRQQSTGTVTGGPAAGTAQGPVKVELGDLPALGNINSKVKVIEFGDFQCPFCRLYFQNNESALKKEYVDTGKIAFAWHDYSFLGQESLWAAQAARCANEQGKFWNYHDYLYTHQGSENSGAFSKANLKTFARTLGLNSGQFDTCLDSDKYSDAVKKDTQYGSTVGVRGTPATFVNGVQVSGAVPYETLKAAIDSALQK